MSDLLAETCRAHGFCPMVVKNEAVVRAAELEVSALFGELTDEFGEDLLMRPRRG